MLNLRNLLHEGHGLRVLALVAHPDDEVVGCGGLLLRALRAGAEVKVHIFSKATRGAEADAAAEVFGLPFEGDDLTDGALWTDAMRQRVRQSARDLIQAYRPHLLITHEPEFDYNADHRAVAEMVLQAARWAPNGPQGWAVDGVLSFELHALLPFPDEIVDIAPVYDTLLEAFRCYESQLVGAAYKAGYYLPFYDALTRLRGLQGGAERGEAYRWHTIPVVGKFSPTPRAV